MTLVAAHLTKPYFDDHGHDELDWLENLVTGIDGPLVVAGDFNQASWSPMLSGFLRTTKLTTGPFEPGTWPSQFGGWGIPIDHVFAKGGATVASIEALVDPMGSNHRGLRATIGIR